MTHAYPLIPHPALAEVRSQLQQQPGLVLARYLPAARIDQACAGAGHTFRQRIFTPAITLWTFLQQILDPDHSCRQAVARLLAHRHALGMPPCSADNSAYCQARARLPEQVLADLARATGQALADQAEPGWLWKGRGVKVVDGTGLSMPDTKANQRAYPQPTDIPEGVGFPLMRMVAVFDLATGRC